MPGTAITKPKETAVKKTALALLTALTLTVAGCASNSGASDSAPDGSPNQASNSSSQTDQNEAPKRELTQRGNVAKDIGEPAYFGATDPNPDNFDPATSPITFTIDNVATDQPCQGYGVVFNGQAVQVDLSIQTQAISEELKPEANNMFSPYNWQWVLADGTTEGVSSQPIDGNPAFMCEERPSFLDSLSPGSQYKGSMWFDVPEGASVLILGGYNGGWEWQLPSA